MVFWIILVVLAASAAVILIVPVMRRSQAGSDWQAGALAIYADQLKEIETDAARGLISKDEARAAEIEIKKKMLAVNRQQKGADPALGTGGRAALIVAAIATPVAAGAIYLTLGSPGTPSLTFAAREAERAQEAEITQLTGRLLQRLETDDEGGPTEGWVLLAQTYMRMGRYQEAADALGRVLDRPDSSSAIYSQFAEALIAQENGIVTPQAERAIDRAREMNPGNPAGAYYKAVALDQAGKSGDAHQMLLDTLNAAEEFAPWMEVFVAQANQIGERLGKERIDLASFAPMAQQGAPGPSQDDVAAAAEMSEEDRSAFIRSMVERLATRLSEEPDDLDGWIRLANAYGVLGEAENARDALLRARDLAEGLDPADPRLTVITDGLAAVAGN